MVTHIFRHRVRSSRFRNSRAKTSSRRNRLYLGAGTLALSSALGIALAGLGHAPAASQQVTGAAKPASHYREVVDTYCIGCHNGQLKTAGLELDKANVLNPAEDAETFEKVIRKLRARAMPPQGLARPDEETYKDIVNYLETSLDSAAAAKLNPGRPAVHRVNRTEYANAIRDLLAVDTTAMDLTAVLPTDDAGYGFDNIADVLTVSPLLIEGYLSAARRVSRMAIGDRKAGPTTETYDLPRFLIQNDRMGETLSLGSRGGMAVQHHFPLDGEYTVRIRLVKNGYEYTIGTEHARQFDVRVDGERVSQFTVGGDYKGQRPAMPSSNLGKQGDFERYLNNADQGLEARFKAKAGTRMVQVTFPKRTREPEGVWRPPATDYSYVLLQARPDEEPAIASVTIGGPYNATGMTETPSRAKIFVCTPKSEEEEPACAQQILGKLARQAYRRPVNDADLGVLMDFYQQGRQGATFEDGIQVAVQRILVDPEFLFRVEQDPPNAAPGTAYRLTDLELASRLAFFLWSSIPDEELLSLAEQNKLSDPAVLEQQTRRMLADPKSSAMVKNFSGQWLYLRNVEQAHPNPDFFPEFDANLRQAFLKETELFFESQVREDRGVPELLNAKYTFLNERLARHYGIPNVYGSQFRRVELTDPNRGGALSQGSILTVTSFPTRTSPTIRGKWLLENILGTPPPPPPPNVPSLDDSKTNNGKQMTVREALEQHRANPACAVCHKVMDPLGFSLENFDATGKWRTMDGGNPIDTTGLAPDGFPLNGPADLRTYLDSHADQFVNTVASKLMTYALGRGVEFYDAPALRKVMKDAEANGYRWSSLVLGIVKSTPFQMRRTRES
jgi:mono/diheme cytochrome c family protein